MRRRRPVAKRSRNAQKSSLVSCAEILEAKGLVPPGCSEIAFNHLVFPASETEKLCLDLKTAVPLNGLPEVIGSTRTQVSSLYRENVLRPIVDGSTEIGIGRIDLAQADVVRFLERLHKLPRPVDGLEVVDLTTATKKSQRSTGELIDAIFRRRLNAFHTTGASGLRGVRIPTVDLQSFAKGGAKIPCD